MQKKIITLLAIIIIVAIIVIGVFLFIVFQGQEEDPLSHLGYINREYGFGLNPPEDWEVHESEGIHFGVSFSYPDDENSSEYMYFMIQTSLNIGEEDVLDKAVQAKLEDFNNTSDENVSLISHNERTVNGMNAYEFVWSNVNDPGTQGKIIYIEKNGRIVRIDYQGTLDQYNTHSSTVEESIDTLVIV